MTPEESMQSIADQIDKIIEENYDLYFDNINIMNSFNTIKQKALTMKELLTEYHKEMFG